MTTTVAGRPLRFGVLCDSLELQQWQMAALEALRNGGDAEPVVLIVNATPPRAVSRGARLLRLVRNDRLGWAVFDRLVASPPSMATRRAEAPQWLLDLPRLHCVVNRPKGYSEYFADDDVNTLQSLDLDFLVKFGFGITRGPILSVARFGVWSFHHDDEMRYRGAPPCFWEIYHRDPVTGSVLQRLTEKLDGGVILKRGFFQTIADSYVRNRDQAYLGSAGWPAQVCRDLRRGEASYLDAAPTTSKAPIFRYPGTLQTLVFVLTVLGNWLSKQAAELFYCDIWSIGVADESVATIARRGAVGRVSWLAPPGGDRYFADPSGASAAGVDWVFAEDFSYGGNRGVIAARQWAGGDAGAPWETVLDLRHHLSYPSMFVHDSRFYCLPECAESGEIALYSTDALPHGWKKIATLVSGFAGVDPTLHFHDGRWWLFCTDFSAGDRTHLHVFYADSLFGPYRPHANNPVKIDIRSSRPAGTCFELDGHVIRPAQNGAVTYGGSITLNRIVKLTPDSFSEEPIAELCPDPKGPFPHGLHTVNPLGDSRTLVDGKRRRFVTAVFWGRTVAKISRLIGRPGAWSRSADQTL